MSLRVGSPKLQKDLLYWPENNMALPFSTPFFGKRLYEDTKHFQSGPRRW